MQKIKCDDEVIVIAGKDKGKKGKVLKIVMPCEKKKSSKAKSPRVVVEGINIVKKHQKGNPQLEKPGGIIEMEAAMDISNIAILNPVTGKADRVGTKQLDDGKGKVRVFKSNGEVVDV